MLLVSLVSAAFAAPPAVLEPVRTGAQAPNDAALLVAIERYAFLPAVPHARRDLGIMADALIHSRGVPAEHVVRLDGANAEQLKSGLQRAKDQLGPGGTLWVYFAGHGAASPTTGELLLVGDDAKPDPEVFTTRSVPLASLLSEVPAGAVVLLDTCWGGAARSGQALLPGARFAVPAYASPPPEVTVWTATAPSQTAASYHDARHGAFTYFAVGALRGWADGAISGKRDGKVDLAEAEAFVARGLRAAGMDGQTPQLTGPLPKAITAGKLEATPALDLFAPNQVAILSRLNDSVSDDGGSVGVVSNVFGAEGLGNLADVNGVAVLGGFGGTGSSGGLGISGATPSTFALTTAGFRAPLRQVDNLTFADASDRIVPNSVVWEALNADVGGKEALSTYESAFRSSGVGMSLAVTGGLVGSLTWIPFGEYARKTKRINEGSCSTCTPERNLATGAVMAGVAAAGISSGIALLKLGKPKRAAARAELLDYVNGRMIADPPR